MTNVILNRKELCDLVGKSISMQELQDVLFEIGLETEKVEGDEAVFEVTTDRPDLLSVEGIARLLRSYYGIDKKITIPVVERSGFTCIYDKSVRKIRPYIVCAIVKGLKLTDDTIKSMMQIQENLHATFGRNRKKGAIGIHDLDKILGKTITYKAVEMEAEKFIPLGKNEAMTPKEVMERHEKGREYGHILENLKEAPLIYDEKGIFSFPPIINSIRTEVTEDTENLLIELTGEDKNTIEKMLNIILYLLFERGGKIYSVEVKSVEGTKFTPRFSLAVKTIELEYINRILGLELSQGKVRELLTKFGFDSKVEGRKIKVFVPPYRTDIIHKRDIVDDIGRAYGFNNMQPSYPKASTIGELSKNTKLSNAAREILIGSGFQDLLNFILTNEDSNYRKMGIKSDGRAVELQNPYSEQYTIMRTWLLPSLMEVLSNNTRQKYPQNLSEVGKAVILNEKENLGCKEIDKVAAVTCHLNAQYNEIKSKLQSLVGVFRVEVETPAINHPSFIEGRCARILINKREVGILGEIHPTVLQNWGIEMPAAAFEFDLEALDENQS